MQYLSLEFPRALSRIFYFDKIYSRIFPSYGNPLHTSSINYLFEHQQGKIGSATLIRDGHEVTQLVNTSYHFDFQTFYLYGEPIEFRSTDTIRFSCIYESPTTGTWTYGGDFSEEEMCFFGLLFLRDNEVLDYDCAQISNARFKKEGYSLPSHMTNLLEQNGVDLFSGQDDKL